jgi:UDP-glucose 4-epimerase
VNSLEGTNCVVIGAGGFIGTNLCRALHGRVRRLRAFGRRQTFPEALRDVEWFQGDFADSAAIANALEGFDTVIHLANSTTPASANVDKVADLNSNVISTLRMLDACRSLGVRRVVFVSSGGTVYGIPETLPTPETAATFPITAYGVSKLTIERYLALYQHLYGLECRILRVANPYGLFQIPTKNQGVVAAFLFEALAGRPLQIWGAGDVVRDYLFIDDVVDALVRAITHVGQHFVFNIGSGQGRSINEIAEMIGAVLNRRLQIQYVAGRAIDVPTSVLDISRAIGDLGWRPRVDFESGLRKTAAWASQALVPH